MPGSGVGNGGREGSSIGDTIDPNSPLYLYPSDYPSQIQVNDVLTDQNFIDWKQEMENFLFAKNKISFVDGSLPKPESSSKDYMAWMRCDAMVKGWLPTSMDKEIRASVKYASTSIEIWNDLIERFGKESAPRAYELKQLISGTRQDDMTVSAYYTKLRGLWDKMQSFLPTPKCMCNGSNCGLGKSLKELREKEQLYEFLMGLTSEFSIIRTQIVAMKPIPSIQNAYHLDAEDERQRSITGEKKYFNEEMAFQASAKHIACPTKIMKRNKKSTCHSDFCGKDGHTQDGCFERIGYPEWWRTSHCDFCDKSGHTQDKCFERIGYPVWWLGKNKQEKEKPKGACVVESNPIADLTKEQQEQL